MNVETGDKFYLVSCDELKHTHCILYIVVRIHTLLKLAKAGNTNFEELPHPLL